MSIFDIIVIILFIIIVSIIIWLNIVYKPKETFISTDVVNDLNNLNNNSKNNDNINKIIINQQSENKTPLKFSDKREDKINETSSQFCNNNINNNNNRTEQSDIEDLTKYYQKMYSNMPTKFDDGRFAGYNHYSFSGFGGIKNIGQISLENNNYPIGISN